VRWTATGLPAGLSIDAGAGLISGRLTDTTGAPVYQVTVTATDAPGRSKAVTFRWTIKTLRIARPIDPRTDRINDNVSFAPVIAGGTLPYKYEMSGYPGELNNNKKNDDISIDPNTGVISGKLRHGDRYLTTITVTDATGDKVSTTFLWRILRTSEVTILVPDPDNPDQTSKVGQAVNLRAQATGGSMSGYDWTAVGLPPGLTLGPTVDTFYGPITGTPTKAGVYRVTLFVYDSSHKYATVMFDWTVTP
jgi:Putative Ig domain